MVSNKYKSLLLFLAKRMKNPVPKTRRLHPFENTDKTQT